jgi:proline iminopeptidase
MNVSGSQEGYVPVTGGRVWYRIVGSGSAIPLLTLHGGPGLPHDYLEPLEALADERPVIFYDQLGCGKSDRSDDVSLWHIARFVEELSQIRQALHLDRVHLLGQSWGSTLATEYALTKPPGLASLILAGPVISFPRLIEDQIRLLDALPCDIQVMIYRHEVLGSVESEEYQKALQEYLKRHMCRLDSIPDAMQRSSMGFAPVVAEKLLGQGQFIMTGDLKSFDRTSLLQEITTPTLFTCGRYDFCTPEATAWYRSLIPGSEMIIFENSAHMAHMEETERFLQVVRDFLQRAEGEQPT